MEEIKRELWELLVKNRGIMKQFKADTYKSSFEELTDSSFDLFTRIEECYQNAPSSQKLVNELADFFTEEARRDYKAVKKKDKSAYLMESNMIMGTYLIPALAEFKGECSQPLTDALLEKWNSIFVGYKLQKGNFADINASFKTKLCYITTAVCSSMGKADDCSELMTLRDYRDFYLQRTEQGRELIAKYYEMAPLIVRAIDQRRNAAGIYANIYSDYLLPCIQLIQAGELKQCRENYKAMVEKLQNQYAGGTL